jgi:hypothetical protein
VFLDARLSNDRRAFFCLEIAMPCLLDDRARVRATEVLNGD